MSLAEFFADHTFRTVFLGTVIIGVVAGALGCFSYLRKQSLIGDVVSHAALPGVLGAFLLGSALAGAGVPGINPRNMLWLVVGAVVTGSLAAWLANWAAAHSKLRIDATMAVSLTLFFGVGMMLMRTISNGNYPGKGGVQDYLFGNASTLTVSDVWTAAALGGAALAVLTLGWRHFAVRSFDPGHAAVSGTPVRLIDAVMFAAIVLATVLGVKSVGLVLMVALLLTPAAAARQWTRRLGPMVWLAAVIGGVGAGLGAYLSIALGTVPTGPVTVLVLFAVFLVSILVAPGRSVLAVARAQRATRRRLLKELVRTQTEQAGAK